MSTVGLSFLIKRLSLVRSSVIELDDEVDNTVKSFGETGCPVLQWCERMLVRRRRVNSPLSSKLRDTQVV